MLTRKIAAIAALSLMTASTAAVAQSAQPLSVAASPALERTAADLDEAGELRGRRGALLPIIAGVVVILAILALTDTWPFGDDPDSP